MQLMLLHQDHRSDSQVDKEYNNTVTKLHLDYIWIWYCICIKNKESKVLHLDYMAYTPVPPV